MTKIRNSKQNRFGDLGIDTWSLFGIWNLSFGISLFDGFQSFLGHVCLFGLGIAFYHPLE